MYSCESRILIEFSTGQTSKSISRRAIRYPFAAITAR